MRLRSLATAAFRMFAPIGRRGVRLPFLYRNRPSLVISPAPRQLQIPRRVSLQPKTTPLNQLPGRFVVGLNIGLEPVESLPSKCLGQNGQKPSLHVAMPVVGNESI